jgi:uncharacterized GH25 family protein
MKKLTVLLLFLTVSFFLPAHEFWLQPDKFIYKWNDLINIRFLVGENFEGENWKGNRSRVNSLVIYYSGAKDDLSSALSEEAGDSLQFKILDEGTCMLAFHSNNSFIELEAEKFNAYLQEDGLKNAMEYRALNNETDSMGREYYQRCTKSIFQVGSKYNNTFRQETSLPLDIIPLQHPYQLKNGDSLQVKILFQKEPVSGQAIKIWHRINNQTVSAEMMTNENGHIILPVKTKGIWMVSTVKMIRLENDEKARWQSYWGSLTWGYE